MPTSRQLASLLPPTRMLKAALGLAAMDILLIPEDDERYFSFERSWIPGIDVARRDNGSGDRYWAAFDRDGVVLVGFAHEAPNNPWNFDPPGLPVTAFEGFPERFRPVLHEDELRIDGVLSATDIAWSAGDRWLSGNDGGGGFEELFDVLTMDGPSDFVKFVEEIYEMTIDRAVVQGFYENRPLGQDMIVALGADVDIEDIREDITNIGYPINP